MALSDGLHSQILQGHLAMFTVVLVKLEMPQFAFLGFIYDPSASRAIPSDFQLRPTSRVMGEVVFIAASGAPLSKKPNGAGKLASFC